MANYQVYIIDGDGRVQLGDGFEAPDDTEALAQLAALDGPDVTLELWQGGRLLHRRPPEEA